MGWFIALVLWLLLAFGQPAHHGASCTPDGYGGTVCTHGFGPNTSN